MTIRIQCPNCGLNRYDNVAKLCPDCGHTKGSAIVGIGAAVVLTALVVVTLIALIP